MRFYVSGVLRQNIDDVLKALALSAGVTHGQIIGRFTDDVKRIRKISSDQPLVNLPWLIPFLHCTTNVLPGYCPDDRPSTLLPFLSDFCGPGRRRCNP
jgi:hypothetical protein